MSANLSEMSVKLSIESVVVATGDQVSCKLSGETAILSLANNTYYGLDAVGSHVWMMLQQPRCVSEICESIVEEYDVEPSCCQRDVLALLDRLWNEGLIELRPSVSA